MRSPWTIAAALILISFSVVGCGGSDSSNSSQAVKQAAAIVPSELDKATSADANLDGEADSGKALTADAFCGFLADETPKVIDLQPAEYAAATFGSAVFNFYTDQGLLTDIDGEDMDSLAAEGCPDAAAKILPPLGATSFAELLSR